MLVMNCYSGFILRKLIGQQINHQIILKKFDVIINAIIYWISITSALKFEKKILIFFYISSKGD